MSGDSRPDLDRPSPEESRLLRQIADGLLGIEALVNDLLEGHCERETGWNLVDEEMAAVTGWLQLAPPPFAEAAKAAARYGPDLSLRRKRRLLRRVGRAFFRETGYDLYERSRERNHYQQVRRARGRVRSTSAERVEELRASAVGSVEVLHGLVTGTEPDWHRVGELASLVATVARELAEASS